MPGWRHFGKPRWMGNALLSREQAVLIVIDVQESYRPVLHGWSGVERACEMAVRGAALLGIPVVVTEQYPKGLGSTSAAIARHFPPGTPVVEKLTMSCCGAPEFRERVAELGRRQVLVVGIETHACVLQTVLELRALDHEVHVARDATSSRLERLTGPAWERMLLAGAQPTSVEQALLEAVRTAAAAEFRPLQGLFKDVGR